MVPSESRGRPPKSLKTLVRVRRSNRGQLHRVTSFNRVSIGGADGEGNPRYGTFLCLTRFLVGADRLTDIAHGA
jgi:hypothetical protein